MIGNTCSSTNCRAVCRASFSSSVSSESNSRKSTPLNPILFSLRPSLERSAFATQNRAHLTPLVVVVEVTAGCDDGAQRTLAGAFLAAPRTAHEQRVCGIRVDSEARLDMYGEQPYARKRRGET